MVRVDSVTFPQAPHGALESALPINKGLRVSASFSAKSASPTGEPHGDLGHPLAPQMDLYASTQTSPEVTATQVILLPHLYLWEEPWAGSAKQEPHPAPSWVSPLAPGLPSPEGRETQTPPGSSTELSLHGQPHAIGTQLSTVTPFPSLSILDLFHFFFFLKIP